MLFDIQPKDDRTNLFGRKEELEKLLRAFRSGPPLILLLGMRRVGKTSLLKVALKECRQPFIYLDLRSLAEEGFSKAVFYRLLSDELSRVHSSWAKLHSFLKKVRGVEVAGLRVELDWRRGGAMVSSLFREVDEWLGSERRNMVVALDEAQLLRGMRGGKGRMDFRKLLAFAYDNLRRVKFVLTGSEVGLLMDFIGAEDPSSPLYGRYREEILLQKFDRETSLEFLRQGFREHGVNPKSDVLEKAVDTLDGVVGWLTYYGYLAVSEKKLDGNMLEKVVNEAKRITENELSKLFQRSRYYKLVLRAVGMGFSGWAEIKRAVEAWAGMPLSNAQLTRVLHSLQKLSIVEKQGEKYVLTDPLVAKAVGL
ncbi:MAG: ATP-binding protein [Candidatus Caldarchaeum sp.]|nr:ATP-binding protein [Candidatus Caldarchaeum sp.]